MNSIKIIKSNEIYIKMNELEYYTDELGFILFKL